VFKKLQVVRFYDRERNVLVYVAYSDRVIEGSPKNSISTVPIMGGRRHRAALCGPGRDRSFGAEDTLLACKRSCQAGHDGPAEPSLAAPLLGVPG